MRSIVCLLCLLLLACAGPTEPPPSSIKPIDQATVAAVQMTLKGDTELAPCPIKVAAQHDMVVLNGSVPSEEAKKRAEELAKKVDGVAKVANHLEIAPNP